MADGVAVGVITKFELTDSTEAVANKEAAFLKAIDLIHTAKKTVDNNRD